MDTFHHQDVVLLKVHHIALKEGASLLEIVAGNLNLLAFKKVIEVLPQKFQVHCLKGLEVKVSVRIQGRALTLHKVIVQFYHLWIHSQHFKLLGYPKRRRSLSAGGRSCDEHNLHAVSLGVNPVGKGSVCPFLAGFAEVDEFHRAAAKETPVKRSDTHNSRGLAPVSVILQGGSEFHLLLAGNCAGDILVGRIHKAESVMERHKVEHLQVAG